MNITRENLENLDKDELVELTLKQNEMLQATFRVVEELQAKQVDVVTSKNI